MFHLGTLQDLIAFIFLSRDNVWPGITTYLEDARMVPEGIPNASPAGAIPTGVSQQAKSQQAHKEWPGKNH